jgi:hypothetical protein
MSGVASRSNDPALVGASAIFSVQDNSEGPGDPPDRLSLVEIDMPLTCEDLSVSPLIPIEGGNSRVRPGGSHVSGGADLP